MNKWYHFKFRFGFPEKWWIDIFLIDRLFRDILTKHRNDLELCRFHRRAVPDDAGHQLSFLCYTDSNTAKSIEEIMENHISIDVLRRNGILKENLREEYDSRIEATSDGNWSASLQKSWPYFIMGVCEMLVDLIAQLKSSAVGVDSSSNISEIERYYSELKNRITRVWEDEGSHAFLHHINVVFGYEPLVARPRWGSGPRVVF